MCLSLGQLGGKVGACPLGLPPKFVTGLLLKVPGHVTKDFSEFLPENCCERLRERVIILYVCGFFFFFLSRRSWFYFVFLWVYCEIENYINRLKWRDNDVRHDQRLLWNFIWRWPAIGTIPIYRKQCNGCIYCFSGSVFVPPAIHSGDTVMTLITFSFKNLWVEVFFISFRELSKIWLHWSKNTF